MTNPRLTTAVLALITALSLSTASSAQRPTTPVQNGIDVLEADGFKALQGKKVGLITNHTGLTLDGRSIVELFATAKNFELKALFSPEHGFAGKLDQSKIDDDVHGSTGLKIISLYGKTRKPTSEMLEGLDTIVFDIQDIGCRFYTYVSTMKHAMEAAAAHDIRFVVLDRPNPIDGVHVEGPVLDKGKESFVAYHTVPVRHGMTIGELARMMNVECDINCDLEVIECKGWKRSMYFDQLGQSWVNPSPNMRNLSQAILYPGVGLLETTNLSVGRGTDAPFEWIGAPWIDGRALASALNAHGLKGIRFIACSRTPSSSKFNEELCGGVHFHISDRAVFHSLRTGIAVAVTLHKLYPEAWETKSYPRLLGDVAVFEALLAKRSHDAILDLWQAELKVFLDRRQKHLIYH